LAANAFGAGALAVAAVLSTPCQAIEEWTLNDAYVLEPGLDLEPLPSASEGYATLPPGSASPPEETAAPPPEMMGDTIVSLAPPASYQEAPHFAIRGYAYNPVSSKTSWLIADDDRFGMVSLESCPTLGIREKQGLVSGLGVHFLDGPIRTDMPPRLFDLSIGYQRRAWVGPNAGYDLTIRVGAFGDFEGSVRDGVRFPSHAVAFVRFTPNWQGLLGVDYLDRDDVSLLPVVGAVWAPSQSIRLDLVFPRPRAAVQLADPGVWSYVRGELGGGTWAIERVDLTDDNATYRDLRLALGIECFHDEWMSSTIEVTYVFARDLSYRSGMGDFSPGDAVMLSFAHKY
jgi:hypothetical protein